MEKQLYAKSNTHNNTPIIDRIFRKARGVHLFPEEKLDILNKIETMHLLTVPVAIHTKKEKVH